MVKIENDTKPSSSNSSDETTTAKFKQKTLVKKRKRESSESSNDDALVLPDNALETERNVHASAVKNNLDETSVRKIIKRVVTNDHVLAFVKLREEEEDSGTEDKSLQPKLTRAKVKELKKVSPKSGRWDLENLELTPIKHIPVKTRPEVKALIAQELPEDEDDDEYQPTHDDVLSDDDHVESCSDLDSQPRTPATPASLPTDSPRVVKDGPFVRPQEVSARRKLEIEEEEATIALRTRSKLSLSSTSIEHIESTFVPPDDLPLPDVDNLWSDFLSDCLNPASSAKHEDDDEADPEYNVAADQDAHDEDEDALGNSLIKISKKELNDLVTELFNIMPEAAEVDLTDNLANSVLTDNSQTEVTQWEDKKDLVSVDVSGEKPSKRPKLDKKELTRIPDIKTEGNKIETRRGKALGNVKNSVLQNMQQQTLPNVQKGQKDIGRGKEMCNEQSEKENTESSDSNVQKNQPISQPQINITAKNKMIEISIEESPVQPDELGDGAPASLRSKIQPAPTENLYIQVEPADTITPEQILILQQQVRQHVQLATSNFLQLFVHPIHWKLAPTYMEYLTSLTKLVDANENSVVNVCNLKPAFELAQTWEKSVSVDTPENRKMIEFIQSEVDRSRRRFLHNAMFVGEFHETFKNVVANSPVFLYPYLLPAMPYRPDNTRRFCYLYSEDSLIALGLDQFWKYVESNPHLYKLTKQSNRTRPGLGASIELVCKHMFPWMSIKTLSGHIHTAKISSDENNPIYRYFKYNELPKTEHRLLPFNPTMTLYEQPEHEMPKIWVRYLSKTSKRFRNYYNKRPGAIGRPPDGVVIKTGVNIETTRKKPLPIDFTKQIINARATLNPKTTEPTIDKFDINIQQTKPPTNVTNNTANALTVVPDANPSSLPLPQHSFYTVVETSLGTYLLPLQVTQTVNSSTGPITTPAEVASKKIAPKLPRILPKPPEIVGHCTCCELLRKICKVKQMRITDYFKKKTEKKCACNDIKYPKITNRLKMLVKYHKKTSELVYRELEKRLNCRNLRRTEVEECDAEDVAHVLHYQLKVFLRASMSKRIKVKKRIHTLLAGFDVENSNPLALARDLFKIFDVELVDLYLDFLTFLTPEQADKLDVFKDYFVRNCAQDLMDRVEAQVTDKDDRATILEQIKYVFGASKSTSCDICSSLMMTMHGYAELARHTFYLFPHRKETRPQMPTIVNLVAKQINTIGTVGEVTQNIVEDSNEADHSSCGGGDDSDDISTDLERTDIGPNQVEIVEHDIDETVVEQSLDKTTVENNLDETTVEQNLEETTGDQISEVTGEKTAFDQNLGKSDQQNLGKPAEKPDEEVATDEQNLERDLVEQPLEEPLVDENRECLEHIAEDPLDTEIKSEVCSDDEIEHVVTISKMEADSDDSDTSMSIVELEEVKLEDVLDWRRDEDKIVLQVLQEHLTPEERKDKTILEMLDEKNVYGLLSQSLTERSLSQIKERVLYILSLLVLTENSR